MTDTGGAPSPSTPKPKQPRAATFKEVAALAGVSTSTVSHVVNGTRFVEPKTAAAVKLAIEKTGYRPNRLARALRRASSDVVGIIISDFANPFYIEIVRAIEDVCRRSDKSVIMAISHDSVSMQRAAIEAFEEHRVQGLVLAPCGDPSDSLDLLAHLAAVDFETVLVDRMMDAPFDQVGSENTESAYALVQHLVEHGRRKIGFIQGVPGISTTIERLEAYRGALAAGGIEFDPELVVSGDSRNEPAHMSVRDLLTARPDCDALVSGNNLMTLGCLQAVLDMGIRVPTDLAMVAFDDVEWFDVMEPRVTTVAQDSYEIGSVAAQRLLARIEDPTLPFESVRIPTEMRHRTSCGCQSGGMN